MCHFVGERYKAPEFYNPVGGDEVVILALLRALCFDFVLFRLIVALSKAIGLV